MKDADSLFTPPSYCQYSSGPCDQDFTGIERKEALFIYPSTPPHLAKTILETVRLLQTSGAPERWLSWEGLSSSGQLVFCAVCKAARGARSIVANVTSLNFNVLFELGFAIGLRKPILPVRDTSYETQIKLLDEIGIFDVLGYQAFSNSVELKDLILSKKVYSPPVLGDPPLNKRQPVFYIRSPIDTDGSVRLFSSLKKTYFKFRTFDPREASRISLHDAFKDILSSIGVIAHLIDPERTGAVTHNARAAFLCGMALATNKHVLMLQEGRVQLPIDYRDLVVPYQDANDISTHVEHFIRNVADTYQSIEAAQVPLPKGLLERIDLGDIAAENEIQSLGSYFVKTPQFQQARQGHARLVIGRKGTGKTALFYGIRSQFPMRGAKVVLDLKPEGHQFTRLREKVLADLAEGMQLHTLTAFWHYLLLLEVANKLIEREETSAWQDKPSLADFRKLQKEYETHSFGSGDFSERLMSLVDRVVDKFTGADMSKILTQDVTDAIYRSDIHDISELVTNRLSGKDGLLILFDNIDKGFPTHGLRREDALIIRCLLEATRKLQQTFERRKIACAAIVFVRRDVYDRLVDVTPDRGKETYVSLDWSDTELIKELLLKRFRFHAPELDESFEQVWARLFDPHIHGTSSFNYIISRTFLRPRDVLNFIRKCIQIAVSRGHEIVHPDDVIEAERQYSEDMLNELRFEMRDTFPDFPDIVLAFIGAPSRLTIANLDLILEENGVNEPQQKRVIESLVWFSFLGAVDHDAEVYSYEIAYNMPKVKALLKDREPNLVAYIIHPAFRHALSIISAGDN